MTELVLEVNEAAVDKTPEIKVEGRVLLMTPPIGEDYWLYRVKLTDKQAIIGFHKFGTIGIGFAKEEDWNTNLPCSVEAEQIWKHICHNKGDESISDDDCLAAIRLIQGAGQAYLRAVMGPAAFDAAQKRVRKATS